MLHKADAVLNQGWDDDPDWKVVCDCQWETWGHKTEESARNRHERHCEEHGVFHGAAA